jgi:hypothetical protein
MCNLFVVFCFLSDGIQNNMSLCKGKAELVRLLYLTVKHISTLHAPTNNCVSS